MARRAALATTVAVGVGAAAAAAPTGAQTGRAAAATAAGTQRVHVQAARRATEFGELRFVQRRLSATAGRVSFVFKNPAALPHNLAIRRAKKRLGVTPTIARGATKRLTLKLKAGRYTFYCAVPGHEASGMKGPLVVR